MIAPNHAEPVSRGRNGIRHRGNATPLAKLVRCAIYTRKSTDEGLAQEFNSLDAQREAAEAFVLSQKHEGWAVLPEKYDDGGFSGGTMERPALQRLLADISAGKVDAIVVYKVDRLSRSLMDFSRIMETLDAHGCSFVSVTQQFNTTHSMGRLTLNILLSFAQFEREIISERTRDKMGASRRKGKWVGGYLILGYDLNPERTRLIINEGEAKHVRAIFQMYLKDKSLTRTLAELRSRSWPRKTWVNKAGEISGGGAWTKANLYNLLTNYAYAGKVEYGGEIFQGEHEAILDTPTWDAVQALLRKNNGPHTAPFRNKYGVILRGILQCGSCGCAMSHTYSVKGRTRYRYYVCTRAAKQGYAVCATRSVPAQEIENFVMQRIATIGGDSDLLKEVLTQAKTQRDESLAALQAEHTSLKTSLRAQAKLVAGAIGKPNGSARLGQLEDEIRRGETRLAQIESEASALNNIAISRKEIASALNQFSQLEGSLTQSERATLVAQLVERVVYDRPGGSVAITFLPSGLKSLAEPADPQPEEVQL